MIVTGNILARTVAYAAKHYPDDESQENRIAQQSYLDGLLAGYQASMNSPEKLDSWISVKEQLPEEGQDCIFYVDFIDKWDKGSERINFQEIGVFNGKDRFDHRSHTDLDRVTYWMPLPKPPEGK